MRLNLQALFDKAQGWIKWEGGDCPVNPMTRVEVKFAITPQVMGVANLLSWAHRKGANNILAYRLIES